MSEKQTKNSPEALLKEHPAAAETLPLEDDVVLQSEARAPEKHEPEPKTIDCDIPAKKRKTRRGKSRRRYPYQKTGRKSAKVIKPKAPYNSNQFLLEDHGTIEELDENLRHADLSRTRDSSFSIDSESEFYSSPDDEEQFLIKDFDDQYESVQAERLQSMSKDDLIQEYLMLETKVEILTTRLRKKGPDAPDLQTEVERLTKEVETLKRENVLLKSKGSSEDSETDSEDSCSSSSSSSSSSRCSSKAASPVVDYSQTNGHSTADCY